MVIPQKTVCIGFDSRVGTINRLFNLITYDMRVKVTFRNLSNIPKEIIRDARDVVVHNECFEIRNIAITYLSKNEICSLANTTGISMTFGSLLKIEGVYVDSITIRVHKAFCSLEYFPSSEDRIKYLTKQIDKMSTELNNLINK